MNRYRLIRGVLGALTVALAAPAVAQPASLPASQPSPRELALERQLRQVLERQRQLERRHDEMSRRQDAMEEAAAEAQAPEQSERTFNLYGFYDVNFQKWWVQGKVQGAGFIGEQPSFVFGNLNTYFDFRPLEHWRVLAEIRFLLSPLGDIQSFESSTLGTRYSRVRTTTLDRINFGETFDYGSIEIERSTIEWNRWEWLTFGAGLFLTPYGIWNIDHGSPTRISISAPLLYIYQAFPERQLGIYVRGAVLWRDVRFEYALTLSNGRGPQNVLQDTDWDKGFGGRVAAAGAFRSLEWKAGFSFYHGRYTDTKETLALGPELDIKVVPVVRYTEHAIGGDVSLKLGPAEVQWEIHANWRNYDDAYRPVVIMPGLENFYAGNEAVVAQLPLDMSRFAPDRVMWGTNLVLSYRLPIQAVTLRPFVAVCWLDPDDNYVYDDILEVVVGLNWRIGGAVVVKLSYDLGYWPNKLPVPRVMFGSENVHRLGVQLAVAF